MHHLGRDKLAHARWKSRRLLAVVSISFGVGESNCSQGIIYTMYVINDINFVVSRTNYIFFIKIVLN